MDTYEYHSAQPNQQERRDRELDSFPITNHYLWFRLSIEARGEYRMMVHYTHYLLDQVLDLGSHPGWQREHWLKLINRVRVSDHELGQEFSDLLIRYSDILEMATDTSSHSSQVEQDMRGFQEKYRKHRQQVIAILITAQELYDQDTGSTAPLFHEYLERPLTTRYEIRRNLARARSKPISGVTSSQPQAHPTVQDNNEGEQSRYPIRNTRMQGIDLTQHTRLRYSQTSHEQAPGASMNLRVDLRGTLPALGGRSENMGSITLDVRLKLKVPSTEVMTDRDVSAQAVPSQINSTRLPAEPRIVQTGLTTTNTQGPIREDNIHSVTHNREPSLERRVSRSSPWTSNTLTAPRQDPESRSEAGWQDPPSIDDSTPPMHTTPARDTCHPTQESSENLGHHTSAGLMQPVTTIDMPPSAEYESESDNEDANTQTEAERLRERIQDIHSRIREERHGIILALARPDMEPEQTESDDDNEGEGL